MYREEPSNQRPKLGKLVKKNLKTLELAALSESDGRLEWKTGKQMENEKVNCVWSLLNPEFPVAPVGIEPTAHVEST
jgi:hypothetical protein